MLITQGLRATVLSPEFIRKGWDIPPVVHMSRVACGLENATYKVETENGIYALSNVTKVASYHLRALLARLRTMREQQQRVPSYKVSRGGGLVLRTEAGNLTMAEWAHGASVQNPTVDECQQVAYALGQLHRANERYPALHHRGIFDGFSKSIRKVYQRFTPGDADLFEAAFRRFIDLPDRPLSRGFCHRDLFRDNVLMKDGKLAVLLDFYSAGQDYRLYDLALVALDWSYSQASRSFDSGCWRALLRGYLDAAPAGADDEVRWLYEAVGYVAMVVWVRRHERVMEGQALPPEREPRDMRGRIVACLQSEYLADIRI